MVTVMVIPYHQLGNGSDLFPYLHQYAIKRIADIQKLIATLSQATIPLNSRASRVDKHGRRCHALVVIEVLLMRDVLAKLVEEGRFLYDLLLMYSPKFDDDKDPIREMSCPVLQCMHILAHPSEPSFQEPTRSGNYSSELYFLEEKFEDYMRLKYLTGS